VPVQRMRDNLYFILWNEVALEYLAQNGGPENLELLSSWDTLPAAPASLDIFTNRIVATYLANVF
jgi:hypothetical protein